MIGEGHVRYFFQTTMTLVRGKVTESVIDDCLHSVVMPITGETLKGCCNEVLDYASIDSMTNIK